MFYLKFGGSTFDEATDDLLHPLGVLHVDRGLLKLRHLQDNDTYLRYILIMCNYYI